MSKGEFRTDDRDLQNFVNSLYDIDRITDSEFKQWIELYSYKGFDRSKILIELRKKIGDPKLCQQVIIICGLNGPRRAALTILTDGRTIESYGIPSSGMKGSTGISCQRITAATADLCAYLLKRANFPKRIDVDLPGWLQFPSAGSIDLPDNFRKMHLEFTKKFSILIGGNHSEQIYFQMQNNSYNNPKLKLFQ